MTDASESADRASAVSLGSTSTSLLALVKAKDALAWSRLVDLYAPLIYSWCRRQGVAAEDASDVVQEVFESVFQNVQDFRGAGPRGSFRAWLKTITRRRISDHFRRQAAGPKAAGGSAALQQYQELPEPAAESTDAGQSAEQAGVWKRVLELVRAEFSDRAWQAFWRLTVDDQRAAEVAKSLGMSVDAVFQAKSRILRRARELLRDLETGG